MARYEATVSLRARDEREARAIYSALSVEAGSQPSALVSVKVELRGAELTLALASDKRSSLRAALNSFLRLLTALERAAEALSQREAHPPERRQQSLS